MSGGVISRRDDGKPIIRSYEDAFRYLVADETKLVLVEAIAVHLFTIQVRTRTQRLDRINQTQSTIDEFVRTNYAAEDLDTFKKLAVESLDEFRTEVQEEYAHVTLRDVSSKLERSWRFKQLSVVGAWQGVCGNVLSFILGFLLFVAYNFINDADRVKHATDFIGRCVKPLFN
jgi:hypothetical protein